MRMERDWIEDCDRATARSYDVKYRRNVVKIHRDAPEIATSPYTRDEKEYLW